MATKTKLKVIEQPSLTTEQLSELADKAGLLRSQLAPLEEMLKQTLDKLKAHGVDVYAGKLFEVNVFDQERSTLDMEAVREKLSPQFIAAHTTTKTIRNAKVAARKAIA